MIKDFLHQYRDELLEEKINLENIIEKLNISLLEEKKFLEAIMSDSDSIFNEFSPRDLNAKNRAREEDVVKKIGAIQADLNLHNDKLKNIEDRLVENSALLAETNSINNSANVSNETDYYISEKIANTNEISETMFISVIDKLNEIKSLIYLDQASAEKEIDILINSLKSNEN